LRGENSPSTEGKENNSPTRGTTSTARGARIRQSRGDNSPTRGTTSTARGARICQSRGENSPIRGENSPTRGDNSLRRSGARICQSQGENSFGAGREFALVQGENSPVERREFAINGRQGEHAVRRRFPWKDEVYRQWYGHTLTYSGIGIRGYKHTRAQAYGMYGGKSIPWYRHSVVQA